MIDSPDPGNPLFFAFEYYSFYKNRYDGGKGPKSQKNKSHQNVFKFDVMIGRFTAPRYEVGFFHLNMH